MESTGLEVNVKKKETMISSAKAKKVKTEGKFPLQKWYKQ